MPISQEKVSGIVIPQQESTRTYFPCYHPLLNYGTLPEDVVNQPSINCFKDVLLNHLNLL